MICLDQIKFEMFQVITKVDISLASTGEVKAEDIKSIYKINAYACNISNLIY